MGKLGFVEAVRIMSSIKSASVKKLLGEFKRISEQDPTLYTKFLEQFNRPLKEGLYSDWENRDDLLELVRFKSSKENGYVSLKQYKDRMPADQKTIYYITGGKEDTLRNSPLVEAYTKKGYEVLIMNEEIDEFVVGSIGTYKDLPLKAINKSGSMTTLIFDLDDWFMESDDAYWYNHQLRMSGKKGTLCNFDTLLDKWEKEGHPFYKMIPRSLDTDAVHTMVSTLQDAVGDQADIFLSSPYIVETAPKGTDKANVIPILAKRLGIRTDQVMR